MSEKANDLLNKFGSAQFDFMIWNTPDNLVARDKARQEISDYIAELEAAQRWIPVSERLPLLRYSNAVLVYTKSGETYSGLYLGNNEWTGLLHDFREGDVTHWMPLPEPPIVYGKVCEE
jgi:hypothetical protein